MSLLAAVTAQPDATAQTVRSLIGLAVCGLSARRGYVKAEQVAAETGALPRNWSPTTWSGVCFASLVVGHVWLASAAGKARTTPRPALPVQPAGPDPRFSWGASEDAAPAWARPATQLPEQPSAPAEPAAPVAIVPPPVPVPAVVQAPPKPFSMNPQRWTAAEPVADPPPLQEAVLAPAPVQEAVPEPSPEPADAVVQEEPAVSRELVHAVEMVKVVEAVEPTATPQEALPAEEPAAEEPAAEEPAAEDPVVQVPRVAAMDVLPAATSRRRR